MAGSLIPEIQKTLTEFIADPEPYLIHCEPPLDLRSLAKKLQVLPVHLDMGGCLALQPDGNVVSFLWDEPDHIRTEPDERIRNMAYFQGSHKFPGLAVLVPTRPPSAETCSDCGGTGRVSFGPEQDEAFARSSGLEVADAIVCSCGGLGWLPRGSSH
jgi:hypothetical protein